MEGNMWKKKSHQFHSLKVFFFAITDSIPSNVTIINFYWKTILLRWFRFSFNVNQHCFTRPSKCCTSIASISLEEPHTERNTTTTTMTRGISILWMRLIHWFIRQLSEWLTYIHALRIKHTHSSHIKNFLSHTTVDSITNIVEWKWKYKCDRVMWSYLKRNIKVLLHSNGTSRMKCILTSIEVITHQPEQIVRIASLRAQIRFLLFQGCWRTPFKKRTMLTIH